MAQTTKDFCLSILDLAQLEEKPTEAVAKDLKKLFPKITSFNHLESTVVRKYLASKGYKYPHQVVSFQMLKGGVAKTTSAMNFGLRASMYGAKVLFIDLDQQANLSFALGVESEDLPVWVDILEKKVDVKSAIMKLDSGVDLIPSNLNNSVLDRVLMNSHRNVAMAVKGPLKEILNSYDLVIIDTAPSLSAINTAVTCASDLVILPINPDKFSMLGLSKHLDDLAELKKDFDLSFDQKILFTKFDARESSSRQFLTECLDRFEDLLLGSYVRTSSEVKNTLGTKKTIFSTKTNAKEDYDLVTKELLGFL